MPNITYDGQTYQCEEQMSVLDCLAAHDVTVPSSCRAGLCQTCLMCAVEGNVPAAAQIGLKPTLAIQNYFLACSCYPEEDIEVALPEVGVGKFTATVMSVERLNSEITCLELRPSIKLDYKAGQFITLFKDAATARSYSLASVPGSDEFLQLHIRTVPNGLVSNWVSKVLKEEDEIEISGATGDCFYLPGKPDQSMMLIGTGSGLAPLYGIIRDALAQGHRGNIKLYHGCETIDALYLVKELRELALRHPNFSYMPCISGGYAPQNGVAEGYSSGMVLDVALAENPELSGWRIFLCGHPQMVKTGKKEVFFAGASMQDIYADPFEIATTTISQIPNQQSMSSSISA